MSNLISKYLENTDWRIKENSNTTYSYPGLIGYIASHEIAQFALEKVYNSEIATAHRDCMLHIHDLGGGICNYCLGLDFEMFLAKGLDDIDGVPVHFDSAMMMLMNAAFLIAQEIAGAVAFNSVDTLLAPYIKADNLSYERVRQVVQMWVYSMNIKGRVGHQSVFLNTQLDLTLPNRFKGRSAMVGGKAMDFLYDDCKEEMKLFNKALLDVMLNSKRVLPFPVINIGITKEFDWNDDSEFSEMLFRCIGERGQPTINNYVNSNYDPDAVKSMCCFDGSQVVVAGDGEIFPHQTFKEIESRYGTNKELVIQTGFGKYQKGNLVVLPNHKPLFEIMTNEEQYIYCTPDHLFPTPNGDKQAKDLIVGDEIESSFSLNGEKRFKTIASIAENKDDIPKKVYCFEMEDKSNPYFSLGVGVMTHNCSLRLDMREIVKQTGGQFGASDNSGSLGVVTLALPVYGYLSGGNKDILFEYINQYLEIAKQALVNKRLFVEDMHKRGMFPTVKRFIGDNYKSFFNTVGLIGMNEMCLNFNGKNITEPESIELCCEIMDYVNGRLGDWQEEYKDFYGYNQGLLFNAELVPGEGLTHRFAIHHKKRYPDIITANDTGDCYYTRGCWLPADQEYNLFYATQHQEVLQDKFSGGANFQHYLNQPVHDWRSIRSLVKKIVTNTTLPFVSISPTLIVCPVCGIKQTQQEFCEHELTEEQIEELEKRGIVFEKV